MDKEAKECLDLQFHGITVLYVEDDAFSREKLLKILERRFTKVLVAIDGEEGFKFFQKYRPELVIADIKMDQMNGLEMIEKIREQSGKTQIIVTTAYEDSEYLLQSIENNVNHFILKPIDLGILLQAIQKSIYHIQLEKEVEKQRKFSKVIMDFQENLIFVVENEVIIEGNRAFSAFTGIDKFSETKVKSLSRYFVEDSKYFFPKSESNWQNEFMNYRDGVAKIKWSGMDGVEAVYLMKAKMITEEKQLLFVCTDITELESESTRNEWLATLDPLTKIYNRQKFDEILTSEIKRAERYSHLFSIILFDIDNFRHINEKFGYQRGDQVLITLSTIVQQRIRETDVFARWGSEEFILITPEDDRHKAAVLAESIRKLIEGFNFPEAGRITCSFGVAQYSSGKSKRQLFNELDAALYESKSKGVNCVTIYQKKDNESEEGGVSGA